MKAYLLAAGYATRLYPLTRDRAKPLLEIGGRPLLSHTLDRVLEVPGLSEIAVVTNHRFAADFERWAQQVECPLPLRIVDDGSTREDDRLGAVGDLALALRRVPLCGEDWLVVAGDNWLGFDLRPAARAFHEQGRRPLLLLRELPQVQPGPSAFNEVRIDAQGRVLDFREKPDAPASPLAAIAVYFFPPHVEDLLRVYLERGGNPDAPGHFVEWLVRHAPVRSHPIAGEWLDIGTPEALREARARLRPAPAAPPGADAAAPQATDGPRERRPQEGGPGGGGGGGA